MTRLALAALAALTPALASASYGPDITLETAFGTSTVALAWSTPDTSHQAAYCEIPVNVVQSPAVLTEAQNTLAETMIPLACYVPSN